MENEKQVNRFSIPNGHYRIDYNNKTIHITHTVKREDYPDVVNNLLKHGYVVQLTII